MLRPNAKLCEYAVEYKLPGEDTPIVKKISAFSEDGVKLRLPKCTVILRIAQRKERGDRNEQ